MLGAAPNGGFEARRRMGVAHFDGPSADGAWLKRRSGAAMNAITKVKLTGDNVGIVPRRRAARFEASRRATPSPVRSIEAANRSIVSGS